LKKNSLMEAKKISKHIQQSFCTRLTLFLINTNQLNSILILIRIIILKDFSSPANQTSIKFVKLIIRITRKFWTKKTLVSDYLNVIDLRKDNIKCYLQRTGTSNNDCVEMGLIYSHYLDSKCYTFMSKLNEKFNKLLSVFGDPNINYYLSTNSRKFVLYIHDLNQLSSFPKSKLSSLPKDGIYLNMNWESIANIC
jgi:hypothetical protein